MRMQELNDEYNSDSNHKEDNQKFLLQQVHLPMEQEV